MMNSEQASSQKPIRPQTDHVYNKKPRTMSWTGLGCTDQTGKVIGSVEVIGYYGSHGDKARWVCECLPCSRYVIRTSKALNRQAKNGRMVNMLCNQCDYAERLSLKGKGMRLIINGSNMRWDHPTVSYFQLCRLAYDNWNDEKRAEVHWSYQGQHGKMNHKSSSIRCKEGMTFQVVLLK